MNTNYPIEYITVPVQFALLISDNGKLQVKELEHDVLHLAGEYKSEAEARQAIEDYRNNS